MKATLPKLVISVVDGVWTDGSLMLSEKGDSIRKYNTIDSWGVKFLKERNIKLILFMNENCENIANRMLKLNVHDLYITTSPLDTATTLCKKMKLKLSDIAFIGYETNDIPLLLKVGWAASPANALESVKKNTSIVTNITGGKGAFKEFIETIITQR